MEKISPRPKWISIFIVIATLLHGILAGVTVDRIVIGLSAWHEVGVVAWANYSRSADLGNGLVVYPTLAVGGALFSIAAAATLIRRRPTQKRTLAIAVYMAVAFAVLGLVLTFKAAPLMLSLRKTGNENVVHLKHLFDSFWFWESLRGVMQVLAFLMNLWSLTELLRSGKPRNA